MIAGIIAWAAAASDTLAMATHVRVGVDTRGLNWVGVGSCDFGGILIPIDPAYRPKSNIPALSLIPPRTGVGERIRTKELLVEIWTPDGIVLDRGTLLLDHAMLALPTEVWRLYSTCVVEQVPIDRLRARMAEVSRVDRAIILGLLVQTADLRGREIDLSRTTMQHYVECRRRGRCNDFITEAIVPAFAGSQ